MNLIRVFCSIFPKPKYYHVVPTFHANKCNSGQKVALGEQSVRAKSWTALETGLKHDTYSPLHFCARMQTVILTETSNFVSVAWYTHVQPRFHGHEKKVGSCLVLGDAKQYLTRNDWSVNISRVTVNCFLLTSLLDVMWLWTSQWMNALYGEKRQLCNTGLTFAFCCMITVYKQTGGTCVMKSKNLFFHVKFRIIVLPDMSFYPFILHLSVIVTVWKKMRN